MYIGKTNENLKLFFEGYKTVSLFNIISPALNASPPGLTKCVNYFRNKYNKEISK
jgi:hypothetical protein